MSARKLISGMQAGVIIMIFLLANACGISEKVKAAASGTSTSSSNVRTAAFSEGSSLNLGTVSVGSTRFVRLNLVTSGSGDATVVGTSHSDSHFEWNGGAFPGAGGSCTQPIQGNCTVAVLFTAPTLPAEVGIYSDRITLDLSSGGVAQSLVLTLSATVSIAANLVLNSTTPYVFPAVSTGTVNYATLTVQNTGLQTATALTTSGLSSPFTFRGGTYPGTGGTCGTTIAAGASCTIAVQFAPTVAGAFAQSLVFSYFDGSSSVSSSLAISGTATALANLTLSSPTQSPYDFGIQTISAPETDVTFTVLNSGGQPATAMLATALSSPFTFKGGAYPGVGGTCGLTLAATASCTLVIGFAPVATGSSSSSLSITYSNGASTSTFVRAITGTGAASAVLNFANAPLYSFGSHPAGTTTSATLALTNNGGMPATTITPLSLTAPYAYVGGTYPGTGGNCTSTLGVGSTCNLAIQFSPSSAATFSSTLDLTYQDGVSTASRTLNLSGIGTVQAVLAFTAPIGASYDFGTQTVGSPETNVTLTVTNSGNGTATSLTAAGLSAPIGFKGGTYPGTGGTCTTSLAAAASCTLVLAYLPTFTGSFSQSLSLNYSDGATAQSIAKTIQAVAISPALLSFSNAPLYAFGAKVLGTSTDVTLSVTNSGSIGASSLSAGPLVAPFSFKGGTYPGTGGTCGTSLASGATCFLVVRYSPTVVGAASGSLALNYFDGGVTALASESFTGTGIVQATLSITSPSADPFDFGTLTAGAALSSQIFTVLNTGNGPALSLAGSGLAAPFQFSGGSFPGTSGTCTTTLAAASSCTVQIGFLATSPGLFADTFSLDYNDGASATSLTRSVSGQVVLPAVLSLSDGPNYDFGARTIATNTDYTFTLSNTGGTLATALSATALLSPFSFKGGTFPGTGGTCGSTLAALASCSVVIRFTPIAVGAAISTLSITYSDGITTGLVANRNLSGTGGTVANLSISDGPSFTFGSVAKNYIAQKTLTVTNLGASTATSIIATGLSAPLTFKGGTYPGTGGNCGTSLGAAGSCTMVIQFAPTGAASSSATLNLAYNNQVATVNSTLIVSGVGATLTKIVGGGEHACALYSTGTVRCWGSDSNGQLGNGGTNLNSAVPVLVTGISTAIDLAAGTNHTCAVLANGRTMCWGADNQGQLGDNATLADQGSPVMVGSFTDFIQISAGGAVTCGLRAGGTIVCWGDDTEGAIGNNAAFADSPTPVTVSGLTGMTDVSVSRSHACGRKSDGTLRCWGSDSYGQLGNGGTNVNSGVPVSPAGTTALWTAAGGDVACVRLSSGAVNCWGADDNGQLGDNAALASKIVPTVISGLANVSSLKLGMKHGCALTATNGVQCWGDDFYGQIGDSSSFLDQPTPVNVSGVTSGVSSIAAGEYHSCAIRTSGSVVCWGLNSAGQLGDGTSPSNQALPVSVLGL